MKELTELTENLAEMIAGTDVLLLQFGEEMCAPCRAIRLKLDRWLSHYDSRKLADDIRLTSAGTIKGIGDGVPYAEIEAIRDGSASSEAGSESITILIESTHGFKIVVSSYDQKER